VSDEINNLKDELLVKYLLQECNAEEVLQVEQWLQAGDGNSLYYQQFKQIWEQSKVLELTSVVNPDEAWLRLKHKMQKPAATFNIRRAYYYAAAAVLLVVGLFGLRHYFEQEVAVQQAPVVAVASTVIESNQATRIDTLSDQSVVTLNKHAALHYPKGFSGKERRVKLEGEAFFSITPDKEKPFFIDARNDVEIRVVGTSFNVKSFDSYTEVIVETGIVEVRKFNKVILLHPREKARIDKEDSSMVVEKNQDKLYKYFRSKEFECDNTPLWKVVEVLNEVYGDSVLIGRSELKSLTLTTRFDNESLESILEIISETFELKVEKKGNKYILK